MFYFFTKKQNYFSKSSKPLRIVFINLFTNIFTFGSNSQLS